MSDERPGAGSLLSAGFADLGRTRRMVFPLYLANLLTAVFAVLPLYLALHRLTAYRPAAERLRWQWDLEIIGELLIDHPGLIGQLQATFLFVPVAYLVLSQLLLGGVLGALARDERPSARTFGADCFAWFGPLSWVALWSAIPFGVAAGVGFVGWGLAMDAPLWGQVLAVLPGALLWLWTDAALDYARAYTLTSEITPSPRRLLAGYAVVVRRPGAALTVHLGYGLLGLLPFAVLFWLPDAIDAGGTGRVLLAFLIRQALLVSRLGIRVASLGSHLRLVRSS